MNRLTRIMVWLRRIGCCRGFGVQSPSAYAFIRYVVNEHYPYYAYADLSVKWGEVRGVRLKLCRLYFRLANFSQADSWLWTGTPPEAEHDYIGNGCRRSAVTRWTADGGSADSSSRGGALVAVVALAADASVRHEAARRFMALAAEAATTPGGERSMVVVEGIGHDAVAKAVWQELTADHRVSVSFDLYYCGIAFFDKRFRQEYTVNF